ncbi:FAD/NAD(P)-binding protein [Sulfidibacter corallicola]|uniref:FAD/NAD(P)-binding protein n=1 Tax=Sulfidibacter corallicola TaxID=2818388 RepID=A0A8A4TXE3_SULCO|nr:FAD/NAD(P)-binding protein [Sulfidibacter corallicola]QTD53642.1 FAD/NAD(P)-binding protein [Sulfidibacter corallicola]
MSNGHVLTPVATEVLSVRHELRDTATLSLLPPPGGAPFAPGQFSMLYVMGLGEIPISLSGDPAESGLWIHTIRGVGNVSQALVRAIPGDRIGVRGPFGSAWPLDRARGRDVLVVAGGIGLAPLRPLIYRLAAEPEAYGRITVLYGARTPEDILYFHQLQAWKESARFHVRVTVDSGADDWSGNLGPVTHLISPVDFDPASVVVFTCGPEIMMRFVIRLLLGLGVAGERIFLSMERNMKCAVGFCGHCQYGPHFVCKEGPVFGYDQVAHLLAEKER